MNILPLEQPEQSDKPNNRSNWRRVRRVLYGCLFSVILIPFAIIFALFAVCRGGGFLMDLFW
jgi:hypothetical protein